MPVRTILRSCTPLRAAWLATRTLKTRLTDRFLHIDTMSLPNAPIERHSQFPDSQIYEAIPYSLLRRFLAHLRPSPDDIVFDIGCGLGRILCLLARMPVQACIGIEISPILAQGARQNALSLKGRLAPIEIIVADAASADYSAGTIYTLFNPFGPETLRATLSKIHASVLANPRRIQIAYLNPIHDSIFASTSWLTSTAHLRSAASRTTASYYTNLSQ